MNSTASDPWPTWSPSSSSLTGGSLPYPRSSAQPPTNTADSASFFAQSHIGPLHQTDDDDDDEVDREEVAQYFKPDDSDADEANFITHYVCFPLGIVIGSIVGFILLVVIAGSLAPGCPTSSSGSTCNFPHGVCGDAGTCTCLDLAYSGSVCTVSGCPGYIEATDTACGGRGVCAPYLQSQNMYAGCVYDNPSRLNNFRGSGGWDSSNCVQFLAGATQTRYSGVALYADVAAAFPQCICYENYFGPSCESNACPQNAALEVCSNHGNTTVGTFTNGTVGVNTGCQCRTGKTFRFIDNLDKFSNTTLAAMTTNFTQLLITPFCGDLVAYADAFYIQTLVDGTDLDSFKCYCDELHTGLACEDGACPENENGVCSGNGAPQYGNGVEFNTTKSEIRFSNPLLKPVKSQIICATGYVRCADGACRASQADCRVGELGILEKCPLDRPVRCRNGDCVTIGGFTNLGYEDGYLDNYDIFKTRKCVNDECEVGLNGTYLQSPLIHASMYVSGPANSSVSLTYAGVTYSHTISENDTLERFYVDIEYPHKVSPEEWVFLPTNYTVVLTQREGGYFTMMFQHIEWHVAQANPLEMGGRIRLVAGGVSAFVIGTINDKEEVLLPFTDNGAQNTQTLVYFNETFLLPTDATTNDCLLQNFDVSACWWNYTNGTLSAYAGGNLVYLNDDLTITYDYSAFSRLNNLRKSVGSYVVEPVETPVPIGYDTIAYQIQVIGTSATSYFVSIEKDTDVVLYDVNTIERNQLVRPWSCSPLSSAAALVSPSANQSFYNEMWLLQSTRRGAGSFKPGDYVVAPFFYEGSRTAERAVVLSVNDTNKTTSLYVLYKDFNFTVNSTLVKYISSTEFNGYGLLECPRTFSALTPDGKCSNFLAYQSDVTYACTCYSIAAAVQSCSCYDGITCVCDDDSCECDDNDRKFERTLYDRLTFIIDTTLCLVSNGTSNVAFNAAPNATGIFNFDFDVEIRSFTVTNPGCNATFTPYFNDYRYFDGFIAAPYFDSACDSAQNVTEIFLVNNTQIGGTWYLVNDASSAIVSSGVTAVTFTNAFQIDVTAGSFSASSATTGHAASNAMFYSFTYWEARSDDLEPHIQIDYPSPGLPVTSVFVDVRSATWTNTALNLSIEFPLHLDGYFYGSEETVRYNVTGAFKTANSTRLYFQINDNKLFKTLRISSEYAFSIYQFAPFTNQTCTGAANATSEWQTLFVWGVVNDPVSELDAKLDALGLPPDYDPESELCFDYNTCVQGLAAGVCMDAFQVAREMGLSLTNISTLLYTQSPTFYYDVTFAGSQSVNTTTPPPSQSPTLEPTSSPTKSPTSACAAPTSSCTPAPTTANFASVDLLAPQSTCLFISTYYDALNGTSYADAHAYVYTYDETPCVNAALTSQLAQLVFGYSTYENAAFFACKLPDALPLNVTVYAVEGTDIDYVTSYGSFMTIQLMPELVTLALASQPSILRILDNPVLRTLSVTGSVCCNALTIRIANNTMLRYFTAAQLTAPPSSSPNTSLTFASNDDMMWIDLSAYVGDSEAYTLKFETMPNLERIRLDAFVPTDASSVVLFNPASPRFAVNFPNCPTSQLSDSFNSTYLERCTAPASIPDHDYIYTCTAPIATQCTDNTTWNPACWVAAFSAGSFEVAHYEDANLSRVDCVLNAGGLFTVSGKFTIRNSEISTSLQGLSRVVSSVVEVVDSTLPGSVDFTQFYGTASVIVNRVQGMVYARVNAAGSINYTFANNPDLIGFTINPGSTTTTVVLSNNTKLEALAPSCVGTLTLAQFTTACGAISSPAPSHSPTFSPTASPTPTPIPYEIFSDSSLVYDVVLFYPVGGSVTLADAQYAETLFPVFNATGARNSSDTIAFLFLVKGTTDAVLPYAQQIQGNNEASFISGSYDFYTISEGYAVPAGTCATGTQRAQCGPSIRTLGPVPNATCDFTPRQRLILEHRRWRNMTNTDAYVEVKDNYLFSVNISFDYNTLITKSYAERCAFARCLDGTCPEHGNACPTTYYNAPGDGCVLTNSNFRRYKCACKEGWNGVACEWYYARPPQPRISPLDVSTIDPHNWAACGHAPPLKMEPGVFSNIFKARVFNSDVVKMNAVGIAPMTSRNVRMLHIRSEFAPYGDPVLTNRYVVPLRSYVYSTCVHSHFTPLGAVNLLEDDVKLRNMQTGEIISWATFYTADGSPRQFIWNNITGYDVNPYPCPNGRCVYGPGFCDLEEDSFASLCNGNGLCRADGTCECSLEKVTWFFTSTFSRSKQIPYAYDERLNLTDPVVWGVDNLNWRDFGPNWCEASNCSQVDCSPPYACFPGTAPDFKDAWVPCPVDTFGTRTGLSLFKCAPRSCSAGPLEEPYLCGRNGILMRRDYRDPPEYYCACGTPFFNNATQTTELKPNGFGGKDCTEYTCPNANKFKFKRFDPYTGLPFVNIYGQILYGKWLGGCGGTVGPDPDELDLWLMCCPNDQRLETCTKVPCLLGGTVTCTLANECVPSGGSPKVYPCNNKGTERRDGTCECNRDNAGGVGYTTETEQFTDGNNCFKKVSCQTSVITGTGCRHMETCSDTRNWQMGFTGDYWNQQAAVLVGRLGNMISNATIITMISGFQGVQNVKLAGYVAVANRVAAANRGVLTDVCSYPNDNCSHPYGMLPYCNKEQYISYEKPFAVPYEITVVNLTAKLHDGYITVLPLSRLYPDEDYILYNDTATFYFDGDYSVTLIRLFGYFSQNLTVSFLTLDNQTFCPSKFFFGNETNTAIQGGPPWAWFENYCAQTFQNFRLDSLQPEYNQACLPDEGADACATFKKSACEELGYVFHLANDIVIPLRGCTTECCIPSAGYSAYTGRLSGFKIVFSGASLILNELQVYGYAATVLPMVDGLKNQLLAAQSSVSRLDEGAAEACAASPDVIFAQALLGANNGYYTPNDDGTVQRVATKTQTFVNHTIARDECIESGGWLGAPLNNVGDDRVSIPMARECEQRFGKDARCTVDLTDATKIPHPNITDFFVSNCTNYGCDYKWSTKPGWGIFAARIPSIYATPWTSATGVPALSPAQVHGRSLATLAKTSSWVSIANIMSTQMRNSMWNLAYYNVIQNYALPKYTEVAPVTVWRDSANIEYGYQGYKVVQPTWNPTGPWDFWDPLTWPFDNIAQVPDRRPLAENRGCRVKLFHTPKANQYAADTDITARQFVFQGEYYRQLGIMYLPFIANLPLDSPTYPRVILCGASSWNGGCCRLATSFTLLNGEVVSSLQTGYCSSTQDSFEFDKFGKNLFTIQGASIWFNPPAGQVKPAGKLFCTPGDTECGVQAIEIKGGCVAEVNYLDANNNFQTAWYVPPAGSATSVMNISPDQLNIQGIKIWPNYVKNGNFWRRRHVQFETQANSHSVPNSGVQGPNKEREWTMGWQQYPYLCQNVTYTTSMCLYIFSGTSCLFSEPVVPFAPSVFVGTGPIEELVPPYGPSAVRTCASMNRPIEECYECEVQAQSDWRWNANVFPSDANIFPQRASAERAAVVVNNWNVDETTEGTEYIKLKDFPARGLHHGFARQSVANTMEDYELEFGFSKAWCGAVSTSANVGLYAKFESRSCSEPLPYVCIYDWIKFVSQAGMVCDRCGDSDRPNGFARANTTVYDTYPMANCTAYPLECEIYAQYVTGRLNLYINNQDYDWNEAIKLYAGRPYVWALPGARALFDRDGTGFIDRPGFVSPAKANPFDWIDFSLSAHYTTTCGKRISPLNGIEYNRCAISPEFCDPTLVATPTIMNPAAYPKILLPITDPQVAIYTASCAMNVKPASFVVVDEYGGPTPTYADQMNIVEMGPLFLQFSALVSTVQLFNTGKNPTGFVYVGNFTVTGSFEVSCTNCTDGIDVGIFIAPKNPDYFFPSNPLWVYNTTIFQNSQNSYVFDYYVASDEASNATVYQTLGFVFTGLQYEDEVTVYNALVSTPTTIAACAVERGESVRLEPPPFVDSTVPYNTCPFTEDELIEAGGQVLGECACSIPYGGNSCDCYVVQTYNGNEVCGGWGSPGVALPPDGILVNTQASENERGCYITSDQRTSGCKCMDYGRIIYTTLQPELAFKYQIIYLEQNDYGASQYVTLESDTQLNYTQAADEAFTRATELASFVNGDEEESYLLTLATSPLPNFLSMNRDNTTVAFNSIQWTSRDLEFCNTESCETTIFNTPLTAAETNVSSETLRALNFNNLFFQYDGTFAFDGFDGTYEPTSSPVTITPAPLTSAPTISVYVFAGSSVTTPPTCSPEGSSGVVNSYTCPTASPIVFTFSSANVSEIQGFATATRIPGVYDYGGL